MALLTSTSSGDVSAVEKPMVIATSAPWQGSLRVMLVGAGGNGARVMPPLMQMLRPGDTVSIIDHDIVEDRNLARQHFTERDIGRPKALVLAERYRRPGIAVSAFARRLDEDAEDLMVATLPRTATATLRTVCIGCVDNWQARLAISDALPTYAHAPYAWIDVGNETRGGQVLMSLKHWPLTVPGLTVAPVALSVNAFLAMPQLLRPQPWDCVPCGIRNKARAETCEGCQQPQASCGQRVDLQTVMVNHMAAGAAINCLSWLMLGIPFTSCGAFFSTLNTMQPIRLTGWNKNGHLLPDTTFALSDEE